MKQCKYCREPIEETAKKCKVCGKRFYLTGKSTSRPSAVMKKGVSVPALPCPGVFFVSAQQNMGLIICEPTSV